MACNFVVSHDGKKYALYAEKTTETKTQETWRVSLQGDNNRFVTLVNNRPALHERHKYKAFYKWTEKEGNAMYGRIVPMITNYLEYYIKGQWKPPIKGVQERKAEAAKLQGKLF